MGLFDDKNGHICMRRFDCCRMQVVPKAQAAENSRQLAGENEIIRGDRVRGLTGGDYGAKTVKRF